ncbi:DinB family protein [Motilibacter rhizosphaerae]|uniref:DinB family protein n=1 Tax=Motilibacter rhizosphaerae TaxID=598652 RepID=A0A4Q7NTS7_9ACTN|nr:DinB family protein [Motilibacter rhizosphaerae]RZS90300.1 DinB family protein [Motilibacter rhizosphaerae]
MSASAADTIVPDDKDWTWVLDGPCPECGFDARTLHGRDVAAQLPGLADRYAAALERPGAAVRTLPGTWSVLEYACHVRDVFRIFSERAALVLAEDGARFANWDQDATALEQDYAGQVPARVREELLEAARAAEQRWASVPEDAWERRGLRSNGSVFTLDSLGRYFLHDVVHHVHDVERQAL